MLLGRACELKKRKIVHTVGGSTEFWFKNALQEPSVDPLGALLEPLGPKSGDPLGVLNEILKLLQKLIHTKITLTEGTRDAAVTHEQEKTHVPSGIARTRITQKS